MGLLRRHALQFIDLLTTAAEPVLLQGVATFFGDVLQDRTPARMFELPKATALRCIEASGAAVLAEGVVVGMMAAEFQQVCQSIAGINIIATIERLGDTK